MTSIDTTQIAALLTLAIILTIATYTELKHHRIPNWLTALGIGFGLLLAYIPGGLTIQASLIGFLIGFGLLFIFYLFGGMGGGDVKLMGAVGALLGFPSILPALVYTSIIGAIMALFILCRKKTTTTPRTIPYGLAIATGSLLVLIIRI